MSVAAKTKENTVRMENKHKFFLETGELVCQKLLMRQYVSSTEEEIEDTRVRGERQHGPGDEMKQRISSGQLIGSAVT